MGRIKGSRNKIGAAVKDMILQALDEAGGVDYLFEQARKQPAAFLALLGKVLPMTVANAEGEKLVIEIVKFAGYEEPAQPVNGHEPARRPTREIRTARLKETAASSKVLSAH